MGVLVQHTFCTTFGTVIWHGNIQCFLSIVLGCIFLQMSWQCNTLYLLNFFLPIVLTAIESFVYVLPSLHPGGFIDVRMQIRAVEN